MKDEVELVSSHSDSRSLDVTMDSSQIMEQNTRDRKSFFSVYTLVKILKVVYTPVRVLGNYEGGSVSDGILTLLAATIGTGILMIPNSMAASGIVWSTVQMVFCALISYYSLVTVLKCGAKLEVYSYQELAYKTYGNWCRQLVNLTSFFANWGSAILYLKLISDLFAVSTGLLAGNFAPEWMTNIESKTLPVVVATVLILPISLCKELKALRYFCILNICFVIFFCFVVVFEAFHYQPLLHAVETANLITISGFSTTFPSAVFAYMSHTNLLDVYKELKNPSVEKMKRIIKWTILFVLVTYVIIGIIGSVTFSGNLNILSDPTTSNGIILLAYGYDIEGGARPYPVIVVISMITMSISIVISQPFNLKPAKDSLRNFLVSASKNSKSDNVVESDVERYIFVIITLYSAVLVVTFSQSAQMIMNIIGSSFFSLICFILPSMFYLQIFEGRLPIKQKLIHWSMLAVNAAFMIWNTVENTRQILNVPVEE